MNYVFNPGTGYFDLARTPQGGIDSGIGNGGALASLVWSSIFTDALCSPDDLAADPTLGTDRRGAWIDNFSPTGVPMGSLLWLYARAKKTDANLLGIQNTVQGAIDWIADTGIASKIVADVAWLPDPLEGVQIKVRAYQPNGQIRDWQADLLWSGVANVAN